MEKKVNKKAVIIFVLLMITVVVIISVITFLKNTPNINKEVMTCIASKSQMYGSATCPHCTEQKKILGSYIALFNITDCYVDIGICTQAKIEYFPTWIIEGKKYVGVKSIEELKTISNC